MDKELLTQAGSLVGHLGCIDDGFTIKHVLSSTSSKPHLVVFAMHRQAEMEKELVENKLARLEGARGAQIADLQSELEMLRGSAKEQLKEKEGRINSLVEELSKTQSLLSEKEVELEGVSLHVHIFQPCDRLLQMQQPADVHHFRVAEVVGFGL